MIVFVTSKRNSVGHLMPFIALAEKAEEQGFDTAFYKPRDEYRSFLDGRMTVDTIDDSDQVIADVCARDRIRDWSKAILVKTDIPHGGRREELWCTCPLEFAGEEVEGVSYLPLMVRHCDPDDFGGVFATTGTWNSKSADDIVRVGKEAAEYLGVEYRESDGAADSLPSLAGAKLVVCHGGLNTIKECIYHGVPFIVVPDEFDRPYNASQINRLGIGSVWTSGGDIESVDSALSSDTVSRLLELRKELLDAACGWRIEI